MNNNTYFIFLMLGISFITGCQTITVSQKQFLIPDRPITQSLLDTAKRQQQLEKIEFTTHDGVTLVGALIKTPNAKFTLLYFGGNMFRIENQGADIVKDLGVFENNLVIFDHRGYGLSQGVPNIDNMRLDANAIFDFIKSHPPTKDLPVIVHGLSLGSMVAGSLSNDRKIDGLVLEGSTTNPEAMIYTQIPWFARPFIELKFDKALDQIDNTERLNRYTNPLLILVGENDQQTPLLLSESLFEQAQSNNKTLLVMPGKGHGNATNHKSFMAQYQQFINQVL